MLVREVRKITSRKSRILLEDGLSFVLYNAEVKELGIRETEDLPRETIRRILDEILTKRSRLLCMNLLKASDRTVGELREKLRRGGYPEEVAAQALDYVASFHYTDDRRYAQNYMRCMSGRKSLKEMEYDLLRKGVDRDTVRAVLSEAYETNGDLEKQAILAIARKRGIDPEHARGPAIEKLYLYLRRKGFDHSSIRSAMSEVIPRTGGRASEVLD